MNPVVKLRDKYPLSDSVSKTLLASHEKSGKPLTLFCPGPSDYTYSDKVVAEVWSPADLFHRSLSTAIKSYISSKGKEHARSVARKLPYKLYRSLRKSYYTLFEPPTGGQDEIIRTSHGYPGINIPFDQVNIFTGTEEDRIHYCVDRISDFFPFPKRVHYVLSNICNLRCVMCPYYSDDAVARRKSTYFDGTTFADLETFRSVIEESGRFGAGLRMGELEEVLLDRHIAKRVSMARDAGIKEIHITTNGNLLTPDMSEKLLDAGLASLSVSIDAVTPESYAKIRIGGKFDIVVENVRQMIRLRNRKGARTKLSVSMILQEPAIAEKDRFVSFWNKEGIDEVIVFQLSEYDKEGNNIREREYYNPSQKGRYACASPWEEAFVYPKGEVSLCCYTLQLVPVKGIMSVGDVSHKSLKETWMDEPYQRIRRDLIQNEFRDPITRDACAGCNMWSNSTYYRKNLPEGAKMFYTDSMATYQFP